MKGLDPFVDHVPRSLTIFEGFDDGALRQQIVPVEIGAFDVVIRDRLPNAVLLYSWIVLGGGFGNVPDAGGVQQGVKGRQGQSTRRVICSQGPGLNAVGSRLLRGGGETEVEELGLDETAVGSGHAVARRQGLDGLVAVSGLNARSFGEAGDSSRGIEIVGSARIDAGAC